MQYIVKDNLPQIISGSGSKTMATKLTKGAKFTYGEQGFAKLKVYEDGSSNVSFYTVKDNKIVYQTEVLPANKKKEFNTFPESKITEKTASIYTKEEINKSGFYKFLWGERYRKYFGIEVNAPTVRPFPFSETICWTALRTFARKVNQFSSSLGCSTSILSVAQSLVKWWNIFK